VARFATTTELLDSARPDLVIIAAPPRAHAALAIECVERGVHVLCEKPLALDAEEARSLVAIAESTATIAAVNLQLRYDLVLRSLRSRILEGAIGKPLYASVRVLVDGGIDAPWGWSHDRGQGGGVVMEFGTHYLDLLRWLFGSLSLTSASARTLVPSRPDSAGQPVSVTTEDWACATLLTEARVPVSLEITPTWDTGPHRELTVVGDGGSLQAQVGSLQLRDRAGTCHDLTPDEYDLSRWVASSIEALFSDLVAHIRALRTSSPADVPAPGWATFADAFWAQVLVDQIRSTLAPGKGSR